MKVRGEEGTEFLKLLVPAPPIPPPSSLTSFLTSAPADASLSPGQFKLWLDATPGTTKLMVKAKDSNGTVRTGSITLT